MGIIINAGIAVLLISIVVTVMARLYGLRTWWSVLAYVLMLLCCLGFGIAGVGMFIYVLTLSTAHAAVSLALLYLICGIAGLLSAWAVLKFREHR